MTISITKRLEFDAGHRLMNHESQCRHIHGHRYAVDVTCALESALDDAGRVVDFGVVKSVLGLWLNVHLDHAFIANRDDVDVIAFCRAHEFRLYVMDGDPSAENIAREILGVAKNLLVPSDRFRIDSVRVWETPTASALVVND